MIKYRLYGNIILIQGDHDNYKSNRFLSNEKFDNDYITLCHWCMRTWKKSHWNAFHLYGHSHGKLEPIGKSWDVGVDNNNYMPLSLDQIKDIMANRPDNPNRINPSALNLSPRA